NQVGQVSNLPNQSGEFEGLCNEAQSFLDQALHLDPDYATAHYNLGTVFKARRQLLRAIECFQNAVRLKPDYLAAWANLLSVLLECQRMDEAKQVLHQLSPQMARHVCLQHLEGLLWTANRDEYDQLLALARSLYPDDADLGAA